MKTMKKFLSMAALALVGAVMTGCSSDDSLTGKAQEPAVKNNVVTLTTTVNLGGDETRALGADGKKTFAAGDQIAVIYKNSNNETKKVESEALTDGGSSSATFTVTLEAPKGGEPVRYIYPASMAAATVATSTEVTDDATINYAALASQDGTLTTLASKYDLAVFDGSLTADATLPASSTLKNKLAILAYTIKNAGGTSDLTGSITRVTVSDGPNTYGVTRTAADGPVYIAIRPTSDATISIMATTGTTTYIKSLTGKTYEANSIYKAGLKMTEVPGAIPGLFSVSATKKVNFSKGNLQYNKSTSTWSFMEHQYSTVETTSQNVGDNYASQDVVSLFGWGTGDNPTKTNNYNGGYTFTDWGSNAISNGGNTADSWRTLTKDEWKYVFGTNDGDKRSGATVGGTSNAYYTEATINTDGTGVNGVILFPDGATFAATEATWGNVNAVSAWGTSCTTAQWTALEAKGCVFLPAAGWRSGTSVDYVGSDGYYWSSTANGSNYAYYVYFGSGSVGPERSSNRNGGRSVRLVREVPSN